MINKENFYKLIKGHKKFEKDYSVIQDALGINDLFECPLVDYAYELFQRTLSLLFKEEAVEDINWWIYEKNGRSDYKMFYKGKEIPTESIGDLWEIVKDKQK